MCVMCRNLVTGSNASLIINGGKCSPYVQQGCTNPDTRLTQRLNFVCLWIPSIKLASSYNSVAKNFEVTARFLHP